MKLLIYERTILAIELRHRQFGYAVYRGHRQLLDWGVRVYPAIGELEAALASKRLVALLKLFAPEVIVVKKERSMRAEFEESMHSLIAAVDREASAHQIPLVAVSDENVRRAFLNLQCETREDIAQSLAKIYPELEWNLPPRRRPWESENRQMLVFDAVALGLAYWLQPGEDIEHIPI